MIDFHTHILPGVDDGSQDPDMTMGMMMEEKRQGTGLIVATPHFYADRMNIDPFLRMRERAWTVTEQRRWNLREGLPELWCGAEVYYFRGIGEAKEIRRLCVQRAPGEDLPGKNLLLLEMPFAPWTEDIWRDVQGLIENQGLCVVLAHVERYIRFQRNREIWDRVMALDVWKQLNAGSFLRKGGLLSMNSRRKFCLKFLSEHPKTVLGSDCHNLTYRRPNLADARDVIARELGESVLARTDQALEEMLEWTDADRVNAGGGNL